MSNFLAIATVTAALRQTLQEAIAADVPGASVTTRQPEAAKPKPAPTVNVYLYQVTPSSAWRNADLPTRRSGGETVQRPLVALDLHYLLTFYGDDRELEAQRLLGSVVRRLHEQPVLARGLIERTLADRSSDFLAESDLADQSELVKLAPGALSLEELSKLWSVFFQTPYVLSMAYHGTVVLIEGLEMPQPSLPVRERRFHLAPAERPRIDGIVAEGGAGEPILANSRLRIRGSGLSGERVRVRIGGVEASPERVGDGELVVDLAELSASVLRAGVQPVQVVRPLVPGEPPQPVLGAESNAAAIVLRPTVLSVIQPGPGSNGKDDDDDDDEKPRRRPLVVEIRPRVGKDQRVALVLREANREAKVTILRSPERQDDTDELSFAVDEVEPGEYLVSVQIDGAESPLEVDTKPDSPSYNRYVGPKVSLR